MNVITPTLLLTIAVFPLLLSLATLASPSGERCPDSYSGPAAVVERLIAADNAESLDGVLESYTPDVIWLPPDGAAVTGREPIEARYRRMFADYDPELSVEIAEARAGRAIGFVRGRTVGVLRPAEGGPPVEIRDKFLALMRSENGKWRISHLMWSPVGTIP